MEDIKNEKFEIDNYFDFTIMDDFANRWDGDFEPYEITIAIGSNDKDCSIVEVKFKDFNEVEKWKIIQTADNCTEAEVLAFIIEKHDELQELLSEKLEDPSSNGQC